MKAALLALALVGLAGCSDESKATEPEPDIAIVSFQTTCDEMFLDGDPRLWSRAVTAVADRAADTELADRLTEVSETSKPALRPHIQQMAESVGEPTPDTSVFKTAAREVANVCAPYVA